ncbi:MAG: ABC transporter permease subunit [Candidatus Manganitrophaceae bacterium]
MKISKLLIAALALALAATGAYGQEGTLKKIKESGAITIGHRESSVPFSYLDDKQQPVGYSIDICMKIVDAVKAELNMPNLQIKLIPVTSATRIPLMSNGTIDLECGSTTDNLERRKLVSFSPTIFVPAIRLVAKKTSQIERLDDMKGKAIVSTSGTVSMKLITELNVSRHLGMNILTAKDHSEAFLMVETGRAVAFMMDDILLASLVAQSKAPGDYAITSEALGMEPYALMLRKDDPAFQKVVNEAVTALFKSGEINAIYDKWYMKPIPPRGITLNVPMSDVLKKVIAAPIPDRSPLAPLGNDQGNGIRYHWNWGIFGEASPEGKGTYLGTLFSGLGWTVATAFSGWVIALLLGTSIGTIQTLPHPWVVRLGNGYVELFRNIPLLVQMFLWFFVLPELLPKGAGRWLKELPNAPFFTAVVCLGFFTSARIAEQVRAGIGALPRGQRMAATAMGLTLPQTYRYVLLPQAFRIILPPLTSEFLNIIKNSAVALTIGLMELTARTRSMQEFTFQVFEAFSAATILYIVVNIVIVNLMRLIEKKVSVPGLIGAGGAGGH